MNTLLDKLLGSPSLKLGQPGVEFGFALGIPPWTWAFIALAAALCGVVSYRRLEGSFPARVALGSLRALLLLLIAVLLAGPRLVKPNETEEKDWVLVLADRSASMSIADAPSGDPKARKTREQQLRDALHAAEPTFRSLAADRVVVWLGFDAGAYDLPLKTGASEPDLSEPVGRRTDLNKAIEQALRRGAARPISGVVLLTDGRTTDEPARALLRRLESEKIPIFTVPLGSAVGVPDLAVRRAAAPRYAFVKDSVPVDVELQRTGPVPTAAEPSLVELVDSATGAVLDSRTITWDPPSGRDASKPAGEAIDQTQHVTLTTQPGSSGATKWTVRIRPSASAATPGDMVDENNSADISIDLVDRPLRVAYFDGYPRWEYRYLKNLLVREQSISAAVMLLASGKRYIQEGTVILDALPHTPEEWNKFDVIILGDVWPGVFTLEQLNQLKDRVAVGGAGLIWIGGEGGTPGAWRTTPLNELLPFVISENAAAARPSGLDSIDDGIVLTPTPAAERLGILRLAEAPVNNSWFPPILADPRTGWSQLYWMQRIDPAILKPTAETLAMGTPVQGDSLDSASARPALLSMRYGAGRIIYAATDEIWRWRYGRGELFPERFWIQIVRLLGRESVARSGRPAILEATPDRAVVDEPIRIQITLLDQALADAGPTSLRVKVRREGQVEMKVAPAAGPAAEAVEMTLVPEDSDAAVGGKRGSRVYATTWIPTESGRYRATSDDSTLLGAGAAADDLSARVDVWQPDDEMRRPQTDHPLLTKLAEASGGAVLGTDQLSQLSKLLPNRKLKLAGEPEVHTLWDTPLALILLVLLLTAEWVGRRLLRLA